VPPYIIVINLDRDVDRLEHMRGALSRVGLSFVRFAAIDGADVPVRLRSYFDGRSLTRGEIGCYASHLHGHLPSPLLVLEDDVELSPALPALLRHLLAALPEGWDIVRLSYPTKRATLRVAQLLWSFELVRYSHVPTSTGAYLLSRSGARKFLARRTRALPVDQDLRRVWTWGLDTYGVSPPPVKNDCLATSTIDTFTPGVRACPARSRRMRIKRWLETPHRHARGVADFGLWRWLVVEAVNLVARLTPRRERRRLFAWSALALGPCGDSRQAPLSQSVFKPR
jgi:glycosyl transferase family 25